MNRKVGLLFVLMGFCIAAFAAKLEALDIKTEANKTSVFFSFSAPFKYELFTLSNPERLVIDFERTRKSVRFKETAYDKRLIQDIRIGHPKSKILRLVFDLKQPIQIKENTWQPSRGGRGLRVDLINKKSSKKKEAMVPIKVLHSPSKSLRDVVVVLDPGHGGKDPGAIGARHKKEKDVVLNIALKLKQIIDKQPGMKAVLTRKGDYYVGLRERLEIARKYDADVFISIHADAFINKQSNGVSVFALSQRGATSEAARWLAEKENYSELGGIDLSDLDDQNGLVRTVLIDLSQTATIDASIDMGAEVLKHLDEIANLHHDKVEQARFVVLKSPDIPSILVETGFISNPHEEKNLISSAYQSRLSRALFKGIKRYFWENPPPGSRVEAFADPHKYIVQPGESLSMIAERYNISVSKLQKANHLSSTTIRIGQKLIIPVS